MGVNWVQSYKTFFGLNYIKIDVIQGKIQLVESIFDVIYAKISFIGLSPGGKNFPRIDPSDFKNQCGS